MMPSTDVVTTVVLAVLCPLGWIISRYFRLVHRQRIPEQVWWMPSILQMTDCRCDEIVDTRFGRTLGKSNAFWGLWYYAALLILVLANGILQVPGTGLLLIITLLAFAHSVYLAWGLYVLRVLCRPCLGAHLTNTIIFAIMLSKAYPLLFTA